MSSRSSIQSISCFHNWPRVARSTVRSSRVRPWARSKAKSQRVSRLVQPTSASSSILERLTQGCSLKQTFSERVSLFWDQAELPTGCYDMQLYRHWLPGNLPVGSLSAQRTSRIPRCRRWKQLRRKRVDVMPHFTLLHVVDVGTFALADAAAGGLPFVHGIPGISLRTIDDLQAAAWSRLREVLTGFAIDGEAIAMSGHAAQTIVDHAGSAPAELVVVGTHGRTGLARLTLGSTAESIIRSAPCSVLVVRLKV